MLGVSAAVFTLSLIHISYQFEDTKKSYRNPDRYRWKETDENGNVIKQPFFDITKETLTMQMIYEYDDQGNPKIREYELVVVGAVSYTHLDVYKRQRAAWFFRPCVRESRGF